MSDETSLKLLYVVSTITAIIFGMMVGHVWTKHDIRKQLLQEGVVEYHNKTGKKVLVDDRYKFIWEVVK